MSNRGKSVKVRGTCKDGHVTETKSAPGRLTWEGECGAEGCTQRVRAKRVPGDALPPPAEHAPAAPSPGEADPYAVTEVKPRARTKHNRPVEPSPVVPDDVAPAPAEPAGVQQSGGGGEVAGPPAERPEPRPRTGVRGRLRRRGPGHYERPGFLPFG